MPVLWRLDSETVSARQMAAWAPLWRALGRGNLHSIGEERPDGTWILPIYTLVGRVYMQRVGEGRGQTLVEAAARIQVSGPLAPAVPLAARLCMLDLMLEARYG